MGIDIILNTYIPQGHHIESKYVADHKFNRLKTDFLPVVREQIGMSTIFDVIPELSTPAQRLWAELIRNLDNREMIVYLAVKQTNHALLQEMEKHDMVKRLKLKDHPRKAGFTTVLVNPQFIGTKNENVMKLWNKLHAMQT